MQMQLSGAPPEVHFSSQTKSKEIKLNRESQEAMVNRLYKVQVEQKKERRDELLKKYYNLEPSPPPQPKREKGFTRSVTERLYPNEDSLNQTRKVRKMASSQATSPRCYFDKEDPHLMMYWTRQRILDKKRGKYRPMPHSLSPSNASSGMEAAAETTPQPLQAATGGHSGEEVFEDLPGEQADSEGEQEKDEEPIQTENEKSEDDVKRDKDDSGSGSDSSEASRSGSGSGGSSHTASPSDSASPTTGSETDTPKSKREALRRRSSAKKLRKRKISTTSSKSSTSRRDSNNKQSTTGSDDDSSDGASTTSEASNTSKSSAASDTDHTGGSKTSETGSTSGESSDSGGSSSGSASTTD